MELRRYLAIIRQRWLLIFVITAAAVFGGYAITPHQARYAASTSLYVGPKNISLGSPTDASANGAGVPAYDRFINTFVSLIETRDVAETASAQARGGIKRAPAVIQAETKAQQIPNTNLLQITVTDPDPTTARTLADAMAQAFKDKADTLSAGNDSAAYVLVSQPALLPTVPVPKGTIPNMVLGLVLGLVVSGMVVALIEYLDVTIRTADDAERRVGLPVLGVIPSLGERLPSGPVSDIRSPRVNGNRPGKSARPKRGREQAARA